MNNKEFEKLVTDVGLSPVPEKFRPLIQNVAFLVEDDVPQRTREETKIHASQTLLGLYKGIPHTQRGNGYGQFGTLPDTITLYRIPIVQTAERENVPVRKILENTIWHEVAHHFGLNENQVRSAEKRRNGTKRASPNSGHPRNHLNLK